MVPWRRGSTCGLTTQTPRARILHVLRWNTDRVGRKRETTSASSFQLCKSFLLCSKSSMVHIMLCSKCLMECANRFAQIWKRDILNFQFIVTSQDDSGALLVNFHREFGKFLDCKTIHYNFITLLNDMKQVTFALHFSRAELIYSVYYSNDHSLPRTCFNTKNRIYVHVNMLIYV